MDSVGLGFALAPVLAGWSPWSSGAAVEMMMAAVVVGETGATVGAVVAVTGPLQCLFVEVS
jgi:hypothetical protein